MALPNRADVEVMPAICIITSSGVMVLPRVSPVATMRTPWPSQHCGVPQPASRTRSAPGSPRWNNQTLHQSPAALKVAPPTTSMPIVDVSSQLSVRSADLRLGSLCGLPEPLDAHRPAVGLYDVVEDERCGASIDLKVSSDAFSLWLASMKTRSMWPRLARQLMKASESESPQKTAAS